MSGKLEYTRPEGEVAELLKKYFVTSFRSGYVSCKNVLLPEYYQLFGDRIREMNIRDDDIWVCAFPKSGTTWTQEMVWCIANDVDLEAAKKLLPQRFPFLEQSSVFDNRELMTERLETESTDEYVLDSVGYINKLASPRFIKTHVHFQLLPEKLQQNTTSAKIIYVTRNSRDTCVSYYHHCKLLEGFKGDFDMFCNLFLNGAVCFGPFWDHVLGYWAQKDNPNVLLLTYEEMKKDLQSVICKTAKFLGKTLSERQIEKLLVHLSFESMKNNRAVNYEPLVEIHKKYNSMEQDGTFMRCGKVGGWKEIMSSAMNARFDKWDAENVKGSEFSLQNLISF